MARDEATLRAGSDGFSLESSDGQYRLRLGGYVQGDGRFYVADRSGLGSDTFLLRRARPLLQGTMAGRFDFYVLPDLAAGTATIQDAYLDARFSPLLRVRVGRFKAPVGLERLQSGANLLFAERALPTAIAPNRDLGLLVHGELAAGVLSYAVAVQNGTSDGGSSDGDSNDGKDVALRVFSRPAARSRGPLRGLGLGIAGQIGRQQGPLTQTYRSPGQLAFFTARGGTYDGTRTRLVPQGCYYGGPFGLLGEYAVSLTQVAAVPGPARIRNRAWQVAASVLLTGEASGWAPLAPARPFDPGRRRWGALEVAARLHRLSIDPEVFALGLADPAQSARRATAWAVGLNWYLDRNLKYVVDYERTSFRGGAAGGRRPTEKALLLRAQVLF